MTTTTSLPFRVRGVMPRVSLLAAALVLAGCASTSPLMGGKSAHGSASAGSGVQGSRSLLNPPADEGNRKLSAEERKMIQSMRMFAVDFGDFYGTQLDGIRRNPSPTETQREMLRSEPVYRDALARLERGEVIAAPHPRREYTDATLQEKLYYDTLSVSNETYRQMSDRCHDAPYTAAGFNRCLAGHYEGRMHHADPDAPKEACRVDISQEGRVSVHANGRQFAPFQIKYRAAGVDYAPSGDIRLARLYGFTGWRKVEALDPLDVVLGLRRETLMVDMTGVGSTREIQMRLEVAGETQPDGIPVYATCMITSRR